MDYPEKKRTRLGLPLGKVLDNPVSPVLPFSRFTWTRSVSRRTTPDLLEGLDDWWDECIDLETTLDHPPVMLAHDEIFQEEPDENPEMTLEEIGCLLGVGKERVRQIEKKALRKIRTPTSKKQAECLRALMDYVVM